MCVCVCVCLCMGIIHLFLFLPARVNPLSAVYYPPFLLSLLSIAVVFMKCCVILPLRINLIYSDSHSLMLYPPPPQFARIYLSTYLSFSIYMQSKPFVKHGRSTRTSCKSLGSLETGLTGRFCRPSGVIFVWL